MWIFNCNYCFKRCLSAIPCSKCSQVVYCDETCLRKAHTKYHGVECSLVYPLKADPTVEPTHDLALRCFVQLINVMGIEHYCSMVRKYNEPNFSFDESSNNCFADKTFHSIYALDGNETKRTVSNLFFMHCTASMMVSLLSLNEYYDIPSNLLGTVGVSLVHLLCIANLNSYASVELSKYIGKSSNNVSNRPATYDSIALILCSAYSLINHSCDPNVIVQTYSGVEVTRAIRPISKGSQLFTDYGVKFISHGKEERSKHLFDQYQFQCQCQACTNDWPIYALLEFDELFISNVPLIINDEDGNNHLSIPKTTLSKFNEIVDILLIHRKVNVDCLDFLFSFLDLLYSNFEKPCTIHYKCIQLVQACMYYTSDQVHYVIE